MFVTLAVLKLLKSNDVRPVHPWNIKLIFVTADVLKLFKSSVVKPRQLANI